jgi:tetratricopeptide (TPR) repeat protein
MTHFWVLAAMLVAVGLGRVRDDEEEAAATVVTLPVATTVEAPVPVRAVAEAQRTVPAAQVAAPVGSRGAETGRAQAPRRRDADHGGKTPPPAAQRRSDGRQPPQRLPLRAAIRPAPVVRQPLLAVLPYALIMAIISAVFVWDYTINQRSASGAFDAFWSAFTTRISDSQVVSSPMLLVLVLFTWAVGAMTAIAEAREEGRNRFSTPAAALLYFGVVIFVFLVYGLLHGARMGFEGLDAMSIVRRIVGHIVVFDAVLLLLGLALAASLALARPQPWPARIARQPALSLASAGGLTVAAFVLIALLNIRTIQADMYFKQAAGYEGVGQWEGAVLLYREAAELQPREDYYYLFLGRSLLQTADQAEAGTSTLPEDLSNVPTDRLLGLVDQAVRSRSREDFMAAAHAALVGAQRLNPYNTDHSANLARLFRAWAFTGAVAPGQSGDPNLLREVLRQSPEQVNQERLQRSVDFYRDAVVLSPNNAGLWNELATVQLIQDDLEGARATLERSMAVDDRFYPTYLLLGDVLTAQGDNAGALAAFKKAVEISPKNLSALSAVGLAGADAGDPEASVDAFQRIIDLQNQAIRSSKAQLAQLSAGATNQRATLEQQIAQNERQLFIALRNLALVLEGMGRTDDAMAAAQQALALAPESDRASLESFITSLQGQSTP